MARAILVQYRRSEAPRGEEWSATIGFHAARPTSTTSGYIYVGSDDGGWTPTIADHQNTSRKRFLNRTVDVVDGAA